MKRAEAMDSRIDQWVCCTPSPSIEDYFIPTVKVPTDFPCPF
jgi:hypothetical protein